MTVLPFFPTPYDDELLYSVLGRYHQMTANTSFKATLQDLFGLDTIIAVTDLPSHLSRLCSQLPDSMYPTIIIQRHTLFPYLSPFLPANRARQVYESMVADSGGGINSRIGLMASGVSEPRFLRLCPTCASMEEQVYGQTYWHRVHQLPGVLVCPMHKVKLISTQVSYHSPRRQVFETPPLRQIRCLETVEVLDGNLSFVAEQSFWLLTNSVSLTLEQIREFYVSRLGRYGYVTECGNIRFRQLIPSFVAFYGDEFLNTMDSNITEDAEDTWLHKVLRKPRVSCHPLRHILLLKYLGCSLSDLFESPRLRHQKHPFGISPWPCLNPAAPHYRDNVVHRCDVRWIEGTTPFGTFTCNCGFVYTRKGPDMGESNRYKGRVKEFGYVWTEKLGELAQQGLSFRRLSRMLRADVKTVQKYIQLNRDSAAIERSRLLTAQPQKLPTNRYRVDWVNQMELNPLLSITQLRATSPSTYAWLYRHDREWLMQLPYRRSQRIRNNIRVNWKERDEQICISLVRTVVEFLLATEKPIRISNSSLGKQAGLGHFLERHLEKLPMTEALLREVVETSEQFQCRRVALVVRSLYEKGLPLTRWRVLRVAGLKNPLANSVEQVIRDEIQKRNL